MNRTTIELSAIKGLRLSQGWHISTSNELVPPDGDIRRSGKATQWHLLSRGRMEPIRVPEYAFEDDPKSCKVNVIVVGYRLTGGTMNLVAVHDMYNNVNLSSLTFGSYDDDARHLKKWCEENKVEYIEVRKEITIQC